MTKRRSLTGKSGRLSDVSTQRGRFADAGMDDPSVLEVRVLKAAKNGRPEPAGVSASVDAAYERLERAGLVARGVFGNYVATVLGRWVLTGGG